MVTRWQSQCRWWNTAIFMAAVQAVFAAGCLFAAEQTNDAKPARYRVFPLKYISPEQGRKFLAELNVGTVSQLPGTNTLLVTAQQRDLATASAVLKLVDAEELFVIKPLLFISEANSLPSNNKIAAELGTDVSIGTFLAPPVPTAKTRAIIDTYDGKIVVIAAIKDFEAIVSALERLQMAAARAQQSSVSNGSAEPNQIQPNAAGNKDQKTADNSVKGGQADAGDLEDEELFGKLIHSLDGTDKASVEAQARQAKSDEPNTADESQQKLAAGPSKAPESPSVVMPAVSNTVDLHETASSAGREPNKVDTEKPQQKHETDANEPYEPNAGIRGDEMLELNLPEKVNVVELLDLVGKYLNLDYMYNQANVTGDVTLRLQGPIRVKDLYPLLESVMKFKGFVMTRKGNLITIVPVAEALTIDPVLQSNEEKIKLGDIVITRIFVLKYVDTATAQTLLSDMKVGVGESIKAIPETGTLIVTDYAYRMKRVEDLLEIIDKPGEPKQFKFKQLKFTMAEMLTPKIKSLADELGTVSISISSSPAPAQPVSPEARRRAVNVPRQPTQPAQSASASKPTVYLDSDMRTNRILMIGLKDQLTAVEQLIEALDVEQQDLRTLRLYDIQSVGADEVRVKLEELNIIGAGTAATSNPPAVRSPRSNQSQQQQQAGAGSAAEAAVAEPQVVVIDSTNSLLVNATEEQHNRIALIISYVDNETLEQSIPYEIYSLENQAPEELAEVLNKLIQETTKDKEGKIEKVVKKQDDIIIVPDKNTFSIIVYASKKNQEWIRKLIKNLDKRRPQVLLDATLVAVTRSDLFDLDLNVVTKLPAMKPGHSMDFLDDLFPDSNSGPSKFPGQTIKEFSSRVNKSGDLVGQGFYSDQHIQALLTAMQKKEYGRVLAQPKVLVNDNEKGTIKSENSIYISRTSNTYLPNTTVTQNPTNTAVTSTTFDEYKSGIMLEITPHISEGDLLRLEISLERSNQGKTGETRTIDQPPPDKVTQNINTVVTVPNKSTIILGGIVTLDQGKGGSKIPLLGDIPLIGGLFRSVSNSDSGVKLYIFVKAYILRPDTISGLSDLVKESQVYRDAFEKAEKEFQGHEDWPGIKPQPLSPEKVLESK